MDQRKATELIERQRRRWRSQDSDLAIAQRAERVYVSLAIAYVCFAAVLSPLQHTLFARSVILIGFLSGAIALFWHSRRFRQIRMSLLTPDVKTGTD
jgi:hypothetical protein